ncbi:MAG: fluoride efflux transporter FluC, partial [Paracoccus sp. (in: a-proteobacteria)]
MMNPFLQVALGGAIGATARYATYRMLALHGPGFPIATVVVNVVGSFAMGLLAALMA